MRRTSQILNVMLGGNYQDTVCARINRNTKDGSRVASVLGFLIDYAFWSILGQPDHIRGQV